MIRLTAAQMTELLNQVRTGDQAAESQLAPLIYDELRRLARISLRRERPNHTLQVTGLVNEAYIRLMRPAGRKWTDRQHFFAVAANVMRRILVDYARNRKAAKRGGGAPAIPFDLSMPAAVDQTMHCEIILDLNTALTALAEVDERSARVIELRFFGGLEIGEIAELLNLSTKTVQRDLDYAQSWLFDRLSGAPKKSLSGSGSSLR